MGRTKEGVGGGSVEGGEAGRGERLEGSEKQVGGK